MRLSHFALTFFLLSAVVPAQEKMQSPMAGEQAAKTPQTARQALLEMFLGNAPDSFVKHLPKAAKQALIVKGETPETSMVQQISTIGRQLTTQGHVETFDDGPTLLVSEQKEGKQRVRFEIGVEHDSFTGDSDEIELSFHMFRDGQPEFIPVIPRLTFSMIQENEVWKLSEVDFAARVPLTDPDYLKGVRHKINEANENLARLRIGMIASAEPRYKAQHPNRGYTCKITELFSNPSAGLTGGPSGVDSNMSFTGIGLMGSEVAGYSVEITGCDGSPATKFQITATPTDPDAGMKAFCTDESQAVRYDASGSASGCLSQGQAVKQAGATID